MLLGVAGAGAGSVPRLQKSIWPDFACQSSCLASLSFKLCSCSLWYAPSFAHPPRSLPEDLDLKLLIFRVHHSAPSFDPSGISDPLNKIARNCDSFGGKKITGPSIPKDCKSKGLWDVWSPLLPLSQSLTKPLNLFIPCPHLQECRIIHACF